MDPELNELISPVISVEENEQLCCIPSAEEVKLAMAQIGVLKAPSPDGMSAIFF